MAKAQKYIKTNVAAIVEHLTIDLLQNRPAQITDYMMHWLDTKGQVIYDENLRRNKNRPLGIDTSESDIDEEEDEEEDEAPAELTEKLESQRVSANPRRSVSAEVYGVYNPKGHFTPRVVSKDMATSTRMKELLQKSFIFNHLDDKELDIIVKALEVRTFTEGQQVIAQGDDGNELFLVGSGQLNCTRRSGTEQKEVLLRQYESGDYFGELALLYNAPRAASITAVSKCVLYSLDRECFNNIVKDSAVQNREKFEKFLSEVEILSGLEIYERNKLCDCLVVQNFEPGQLVIKEGERGNSFYLVIEGEAQAVKINPASKKEEVVLEYRERMYFGELSLLRDEPRAASVVAKVNLLDKA